MRRGDITLWLDEEVIECLLTLRELFRLSYRQTEGLGRALVQLMNVDVPIPSFTLLAKLQIALDIEHLRGPIDVAVDSTGLKLVSEGEWRSTAYQTPQRKSWQKLHLFINPATQEIMAETLTSRSTADAQPVPELLDQVQESVEKLYGDGASRRGPSTSSSVLRRSDI